MPNLRATLFAVLISARAFADEDTCSQILKYGIWEETSQVSTIVNSQEFATWACNAKSQNAGSGAGIAVPGYGTVNLRKSESSSSADCSNSAGSYQLSASFRESMKTAAPAIANAWQKCVTALGSQASILYSDTSSFSLRLARNVDDGEPKATAHIQFLPQDAVRCTRAITDLSSGFAFTKSATIACQRLDPTKAVTIEINFVPGGGRILVIPAISPPAPRAQRVAIEIPVTRITRGENVEVGGGLAANYGADVLHNGPPYKNFPRPRINTAEFDFDSAAEGAYRLEIEYAAAESRPVAISINGAVTMGGGLSAITGNWTKQQWKNQGTVTLKEGKNTLRLSRNDVFPHIRAIRFIPAD
ncbi:MAG: hypothetical protein EOO70_02460 [Myxococcaceae bacterium]|nr:MAG: hypothetical protein EOO70_02460 [Myxococcaceae bacterium]